MKKKLTLLFSLAGIICLSSFAQDKVLSAQISPGYTYASVSDPINQPSNAGAADPDDRCYSCDGFTQKVSNETASALRLGIDFPLGDHLFFGTGLWIVNKGIHISNRDGGYYGESRYRATYLTLPLLFRYKTNELTDNLSLLFSAGAMIETKGSERLVGGDGAHYWNLSNNRSDLDPTRGQNGNGRNMALFSPFDFGIHFGASALYQLLDNLGITAGFSYSRSFVNMINPNLLFQDGTKVSDSVTITNAVMTLNLGVRYTL